MRSVHERLEDIALELRAAGGRFACVALNDEREFVRVGEASAFVSASIAKLPVLIEAVARTETGELQLDRVYQTQDSDLADGSGLLRHLRAPAALSLEMLLTLTAAISDNTAANTVMRLVTYDATRRRMDAIGLRRSTLPDRFCAVRSATPALADAREYAHVVHELLACNTTAAKSVLSLLTTQQNARRIGAAAREVPNARWGSKTGTLFDTVADVGFVQLGDRSVAIAIFVEGMRTVSEAEVVIARSAALVLVEARLLLTLPEWAQ